MTFEKSEIEPEFREPTKEELRRQKISAFARSRRRTNKGRFRLESGQKKWIPSREFIQMVYDTFLEEGFPKRRIKIHRRKKRFRLNLPCRGYKQTDFILRKFYTPWHVRQFLTLYMRWSPERRSKGGRPRKKRDATNNQKAST